MLKDLLRILALSVAIIALGACTSDAAPLETGTIETLVTTATLVGEIETPDPAAYLSLEQARDAAVEALVSRFGLPAPLDWQRQVEDEVDGVAGALFTAEGWVVRAEPDPTWQAGHEPIYRMAISHVPSGLAWEGTVDSVGAMRDTSLIPPVLVASGEQARDLAAELVAQTRGLPLPGAWVDESSANSSPGRFTNVFSAGPWVVQVSHEAGAPLVTTYEIILDHMTASVRWVGEVDSRGTISGEFVGGSNGIPQVETVEGWVGRILASAPGAQFDDYFEIPGQSAAQYGIDGADDNLRSQLAALRGTGAFVRIWGTLHRDVPDAYGVQIVVTRLEIVSQ
jgi:hypothetical protein